MKIIIADSQVVNAKFCICHSTKYKWRIPAIQKKATQVIPQELQSISINTEFKCKNCEVGKQEKNHYKKNFIKLSVHNMCQRK